MQALMTAVLIVAVLGVAVVTEKGLSHITAAITHCHEKPLTIDTIDLGVEH